MFYIMDKLGAGAFGVVSEARKAGSTQPLAVKLMVPTTEKERSHALFECDILRRLGSLLPADGCVPKYIAHSSGPDSIAVVMSKSDSKVLGEWLYGTSCAPECTPLQVDTSDVVLGDRVGSKTLADAIAISAALARQMAPVFAVLQGIAYHRDVSAHNFMIKIDESSCPRFTMIDFGLAVDSRTWSQEWRSFEIGGDPRYWSPAAWMQFVHGPSHLEQHPDARVRNLYVERLDHYSFGVLLLETFFELWGGAVRDPDCGAAMMKVHAVWRSYWAHSCSLMTRIFESADLLRNQMGRSRELQLFSATHRILCSSLRDAAVAEAAGTELSALLLLIVELIDLHGTVSWEQVPAFLAKTLAISMKSIPETVVAQAKATNHCQTLSAQAEDSLPRADASTPPVSSTRQAAPIFLEACGAPAARRGRRMSEPACVFGERRSGPPIFRASMQPVSSDELYTGRRCQ